MQETFACTLAETTLHNGWHQTAAYYQTTQLHLDSLPYSEGTIWQDSFQVSYLQ
jgi:hypothetical protein